MPRPRKATKATKEKVETAKKAAETPKTLREYRTRTAEDSTPKPVSKGQMTTVVEEELYNACKQDLMLGGQRFVPGAIIPKEFLTEASKTFYLQGGHIASRKKLRTVRLK